MPFQELLGNAEANLLGVWDDLPTFFDMPYEVGGESCRGSGDCVSIRGCVCACTEAHAHCKLTPLMSRTQSNENCVLAFISIA